MGPIGAQEMIFIFILALLLFGPKKLPELGRLLGKGLTEFRRAKNELKTTFESHMQELEKETRLTDKAEPSKWDQNSGSHYSSASYPYPYDEYGRQSSSSDTPSTDTPEPSSDASASSSTAETNSHSSYPSEPVAGTVPRSSAPHAAEPANAKGEPVSAAVDENRQA